MIQQPHSGMDSPADFADLPQGLGMSLAMDPQAMQTFSTMDPKQKAQVVSYIQGATSGRDAKERVAKSLAQLHTGTGQWS